MIKKYARKDNPTYTVEGITFDGTQGDVVYRSRDLFSVMLGNAFHELYEEIV